MKRCSLKRDTRPKAIWGALVSAGIGALGNVIGSYQQAKAQEEQARMYADGIRQQNENAVKLQNQMIDVMKSENEKNRQLMATSSLNEAMQMGGENAKSIYNMNRIVLRKGGKVARRKLRNGNDAIPFRVLRGGEVLPIGQDEVGTIGIISGRTHDNGGVDMNFRDGQKIEAEGGELIRIPMNGEAQAEILSRRTRNGFNPTAEVESGNMTFDEAFANQEINKKMYRRSLKRTKAAAGRPVVYGGSFQNRYTYPTLNIPTTAIPYSNDEALNYLRALRPVDGIRENYVNPLGYFSAGTPTQTSKSSATSSNSTVTSPYTGFDTSKYYDTARRAATINTIGNIGGALLSGVGGLIGAGIQARGYRNAAAQYAGLPDRMRYVSVDDLANDFRAPKAVASLAAITDQTTGQQGALERNYQTLRRSLRRDTRSAAAGQAKLATALTNYTDARSKLADTDAELRNRIAIANADTLTKTSQFNAENQMRANQNIADLKLRGMQFNAETYNNALGTMLGANADAALGRSRAWASGVSGALGGLGNAVNKSADSWSNTINELNANQMNIDYLMYGRDPSEQINYALNSGNVEFARWIYDRYKDTNPTMVAPIKSRFNFA